ncbi:MAG: hypothetical protein KDC83_09770 [Flavobacteriales bacterium]|nr:hypothetical protein [Flavobacteriales bacterium]
MRIIISLSKQYLFWVLLFFFLSKNLISQSLEANHWYFGIEAGIKFYPNGPISEANSKSWSSGEVAAISDQNGHLLFYVSGKNIYGFDHLPINNSPLSYSGKHLIIKRPESPNLYYLITSVSAQIPGNNFASLLKIVEIEIDVKTKVAKLNQSGSTLPFVMRSGGFCVTDHLNGNDKWLIVKSDTLNSYCVIPITSKGIEFQNRSNMSVGSTFSGGIPNIKSSPNSEYFSLCSNQPSNLLQLFSINKANGIITKKIFSDQKLGPFEVYSASFSPNSERLIVSRRGQLLSYLIRSNDSLQISNSMTVIKKSINANDVIYDLQLGLDGYIYFIDGNIKAQLSKKISRIKCPNFATDSTFIQDTLIGPLGRNLGSQLPTLNQTLYVNTHKLQAQSLFKDTLCVGDSTQLLAYGASADQFIWSPGVGLSCTNCASPMAAPSKTTTYRVIGRATSCTIDQLDTAFVTVYVVPPTGEMSVMGDKEFCAGDTARMFLSAPYRSLLWSNASSVDTLKVSQAGVYSVTVTTPCYTKTVHHVLTQIAQPNFSLSPKDTTVCLGQKVLLRGVSNATIYWFDGSSGNSTYAFNAGAYYEYAQNRCGSAIDTAIIRHSVPKVICVVDSLSGFAPFSTSAYLADTFTSYSWKLNGLVLGNASKISLVDLPADTHSLWAIARNNFGCSDSVLKTIVVYPKPEPPEEPPLLDTMPLACSVTVFPNPFVQEFTLSTPSKKYPLTEISITGSDGKSILIAKELVYAQLLTVSLPLEANATYFIRYFCNASWFEHKVVKLR